MYNSTTCLSPVGVITLACDGENLVGLWMEGQKYHSNTIPEEMIPRDDTAIFDATKKWLGRYFSGMQPDVSELPLAPIGGEFRQAVWNTLCKIPYGQVTTYGDIAKQVAKRLGKPHMSSRAIGGAVGHNPISIIIPCHRVVGTNGSLTGYSGGVDIKEKLLKLEGVDLARFSVPTRGTAL